VIHHARKRGGTGGAAIAPPPPLRSGARLPTERQLSFVSLETFSRGEPITALEYAQCEPVDLALHRARAELGTTGYDMFHLRCEQFAHWCTTANAPNAKPPSMRVLTTAPHPPHRCKTANAPDAKPPRPADLPGSAGAVSGAFRLTRAGAGAMTYCPPVGRPPAGGAAGGADGADGEGCRAAGLLSMQPGLEGEGRSQITPRSLRDQFVRASTGLEVEGRCVWPRAPLVGSAASADEVLPVPTTALHMPTTAPHMPTTALPVPVMPALPHPAGAGSGNGSSSAVLGSAAVGSAGLSRLVAREAEREREAAAAVAHAAGFHVYHHLAQDSASPGVEAAERAVHSGSRTVHSGSSSSSGAHNGALSPSPSPSVVFDATSVAVARAHLLEVLQSRALVYADASAGAALREVVLAFLHAGGYGGAGYGGGRRIWQRRLGHALSTALEYSMGSLGLLEMGLPALVPLSRRLHKKLGDLCQLTFILLDWQSAAPGAAPGAVPSAAPGAVPSAGGAGEGVSEGGGRAGMAACYGHGLEVGFVTILRSALDAFAQGLVFDAHAPSAPAPHSPSRLSGGRAAATGAAPPTPPAPPPAGAAAGAANDEGRRLLQLMRTLVAALDLYLGARIDELNAALKTALETPETAPEVAPETAPEAAPETAPEAAPGGTTALCTVLYERVARALSQPPTAPAIDATKSGYAIGGSGSNGGSNGGSIGSSNGSSNGSSAGGASVALELDLNLDLDLEARFLSLRFRSVDVDVLHALCRADLMSGAALSASLHASRRVGLEKLTEIPEYAMDRESRLSMSSSPFSPDSLERPLERRRRSSHDEVPYKEGTLSHLRASLTGSDGLGESAREPSPPPPPMTPSTEGAAAAADGAHDGARTLDGALEESDDGFGVTHRPLPVPTTALPGLGEAMRLPLRPLTADRTRRDRGEIAGDAAGGRALIGASASGAVDLLAQDGPLPPPVRSAGGLNGARTTASGMRMLRALGISTTTPPSTSTRSSAPSLVIVDDHFSDVIEPRRRDG